MSKLKLGDTEVAKTGNWSYTSGTLKIKKELLSAKDNGDYAFTIVMSNGDTATITVTVAD